MEYIFTDEQWEIIKAQLPKPKTTGRPALNPRTVFNAICWILSSGAKWRYIPKEYGNWNSIYHKFRQWCKLGIFEKILKALTDSKYSLLEMDSTFCKVHQNATGALKKLGDQAIGVSRGGKTTKIHVLVNENFRSYIENHNGVACIPDKSKAVVKHDFDKELYKSGNVIERFFQRIKKYRQL